MKKSANHPPVSYTHLGGEECIQMSEPVSISYKCKFCGNQQNKSLRSGPPNPGAVSYTHLDVYKRQVQHLCAQGCQFQHLVKGDLVQLAGVAHLAGVCGVNAFHIGVDPVSYTHLYLVSQIPEKEGYLKLQSSIEEYNTQRLQSALSAQ